MQGREPTRVRRESGHVHEGCHVTAEHACAALDTATGSGKLSPQSKAVLTDQRLSGHRFPLSVTGYAVCIHHRYALSHHRDVEEPLFGRGVEASRESIRTWRRGGLGRLRIKFSEEFAHDLCEFRMNSDVLFIPTGERRQNVGSRRTLGLGGVPKASGVGAQRQQTSSRSWR